MTSDRARTKKFGELTSSMLEARWFYITLITTLTQLLERNSPDNYAC